MCERQKQTYGMSAHKSRSFVNMFAGQWSLPLSKRCIDSIRPSVLVKLSCRLCRLVPFLFAVRNASDAPFEGTTCFRQHGLDAAVLLRQHVPACFISTAVHMLNRHVFSPNITVEPVALCPTCWICVAAQVFQSYSDVG